VCVCVCVCVNAPGTCNIPTQISISATEWMIPFNLLTDVPKIHIRAGFDKKGN
jgi:hypothetical protein